MACARWSFWKALGLTAVASALVSARSTDKRGEQTQAYCTTNYNWASNQQGLSPCLLTAFVWGTCFTGNWNVPALTPGNAYTLPNSTTANLCTCSWAAYNLISACTACQELPGSTPYAWAGYITSCGGFLTDAYFPSNVTLPPHTGIPYWAATNPSTWQDGRFNVDQAKELAGQGQPDIIQPSGADGSGTPSQKSKPPIGAIVGGVVGGIAVLAIGGLIAFCFLRRGKSKGGDSSRAPSLRPYSYGMRPQIHGRSMSDVSGKSILSPLSPQSQSAAVSIDGRPVTMYTTQTGITNGHANGLGHGHTLSGGGSSVHSLSYLSGYGSPVRVTSPLPGPAVSPVAEHPEDIIEPFTASQPSSPPPMTRKGSESTLRTTTTSAYNQNQDAPLSPSPSAAVFNLESVAEADLGIGTSSDGMHMNPPAYTRYPSPEPEPVDRVPSPTSPTVVASASGSGSAAGRVVGPPGIGHGTRREKASVDSQTSHEPPQPRPQHLRAESSISAIHEIIDRFRYESAAADLGTAPSVVATTVATGQSGDIGAGGRPGGHKPTVSNPDNGPSSPA